MVSRRFLFMSNYRILPWRYEKRRPKGPAFIRYKYAFWAEVSP